MGYYVNYEFENVKIKKENEQNCIKAINEISVGVNNPWVDCPEEETGYRFLQEAFESWRFCISDFDGYLWLDDFSGEKLGTEDQLFHAIAPFVESGGFIYGRGEAGELWRFAFVDGICREQQAKITYE